MKATVVAASLLGAVAMASPTDKYPESYGKYDNYGDYKNVDYKPAPAPKPEAPKGYGGWGKGKGSGDKGFPIPFTSTFRIKATPEQVVNDEDEPTGGLAGSLGFYDFGLNTELDLICYYIKITGFQGEFTSPADTSTHIHQAVRGEFGPPRIAIPNPGPTDDPTVRIGAGCLSGPFETGLMPNGTDTGAGFTIAALEATPSDYYADYHSDAVEQVAAGNVRGQFA